MWVQGLGRVTDVLSSNGKEKINPITSEERESFMMESNSPFGIVKHVAPVAKYSETSSYYELPVVPLGAHMPVW
jgi:hypothetical protein